MCERSGSGGSGSGGQSVGFDGLECVKDRIAKIQQKHEAGAPVVMMADVRRSPLEGQTVEDRPASPASPASSLGALGLSCRDVLENNVLLIHLDPKQDQPVVMGFATEDQATAEIFRALCEGADLLEFRVFKAKSWG